MPDPLDGIEVMPDGRFNIDAWVDAQSEERLLVAYERASRAVESLYDEEAIADEFAWQLRLMCAQDIADQAIRAGVVTASVLEDGSLRYDRVHEQDT